jgi:hypothetical protein
MVKINLLGPEEAGASGQKGARPPEPHEEVLSPVPDEELPPELDQPPRKSWLWPVVGLVVLAALVVAGWFFLQGRGGMKATLRPGAKAKPEAPEVSAPPPSTGTTAAGARPESLGVSTAPAAAPAATGFPASVLAPTVAAVRDIGRTLEAVGTSARLGLVSRSESGMVVELVAKSDADLDGARQAYLAAFPGAEIKASSRDSKILGGQRFRQEILSVALPSTPVSTPSQVQFLDKARLNAALRDLAKQAGLSVRTLDCAPQVEEAQLKKTPVFFRAVGRKEAISRFLEEMTRQAWNLRITKVLLVPADVYGAEREGLFTLVLQMDLCEER